MKFSRWSLASALAALACTAAMGAQAFPEKPVRLIVPYAAGSASDIVARAFAEPLGRALGQPVIIDNKPGGNSTLGTNLAAKAAPDGYTLVLAAHSGLAASPAGLIAAMPYDPTKDLGYVTLVGAIPFVWITNNAMQAKSARELIDLLKAHPGTYNYASGNTGGISYGGYLKKTYGLDIAHVPYKSTPPALVDLIGGQVQVMMADVGTAVPMVRSGKVRAIAMPTPQRNPLLPEVPTFAENGLQTPPDLSGWWALAAPAATPPEVLDRLNTEMVKILSTPEIKSIFLRSGVEATPSTREKAAQYQREQLRIWTRIVKELDLKPE